MSLVANTFLYISFAMGWEVPWSPETPFPMVGRESSPTERSARLPVVRTGGESSGDDVSR